MFAHDRFIGRKKVPGSFPVVHTNTQDESLCEFECPQVDLASPGRLRDPPEKGRFTLFL